MTLQVLLANIRTLALLSTSPSLSSRTSVSRAMAIGALSNSRYNAVDEEARAEVDVLNSRLDRTSQLTKKIQASLGRLEATGQSVRDVAGPLNGETRRLQTLCKSQPHSLVKIESLLSRRARCRICAYGHRSPAPALRQQR